MSLCRICERVKPKRDCPGIHGAICAPCCGREREVSVDCPLDCQYLIESRLHEKPRDIDPAAFPNLDIKVTESFVQENEALLVFLARALLEAALATPRAVDIDVREALEAMIQTQKTLESGLIYQSRPDNVYAAAIQERVENAIGKFREESAKSSGLHTIRDAQILGLLVFLERLQIQHNNGRPRGRAFLGFLSAYFPAPGDPASSLAV